MIPSLQALSARREVTVAGEVLGKTTRPLGETVPVSSDQGQGDSSSGPPGIYADALFNRSRRDFLIDGPASKK
jgi:hypothetical protein